MTGIEVGLLSVVAILVLIYSGMYVTVALGLVSFVAVWYLRDGLEAPVYLVTLAALVAQFRDNSRAHEARP